MRGFVDTMAVFQGQVEEMKSCLPTKRKKWTKVEGSPFNASQSCDKECRVLRQNIYRPESSFKDLLSQSLRTAMTGTAMTAFFMSSFFKRTCV